MGSVCKILENFSSVIYPSRFCRYFDQDCTFLGSDIISYQLRIRMGSNQRKLIVSAHNAKSFEVAIICFCFFSSTANLDGLTKVSCRIFSKFVKLYKSGLILRHWKTLCDKHLFQSEISCVKVGHAMYFRENNNRGSKQK